MAHFAELDSNNVVKRVIVISNDNNVDSDGNEDESVGIAFCRSLYGANTNWKQTSYHENMRKRYAGKGCLYNAELDIFTDPQPYPSWTLNTSTGVWVCPLGDAPELTAQEVAARSYYEWDEDAYQADNTTGWVLKTE